MSLNNPLTIGEQLKKGKALLKACGVSSYALDAQLLLMEAAGLTKTQLLLNGDMPLQNAQNEAYNAFLQQRAAFKPVQYITHRCEFMSLNFYVDENVLIPRPDTEILVETAVEYIKQNSYADILELGTGSGCISVSLARYCPQTRVTAADISIQALAVAEKNAKAHHVSERLRLVESDLFANIEKNGGFDLIVSNPPYIRSRDLIALPDNVKNFEPHTALDGGGDGLFFYRSIAETCRSFMRRSAVLLLEIGCDQRHNVGKILRTNGFRDITIIKDLAGLDRVVTCRL